MREATRQLGGGSGKWSVIIAWVGGSDTGQCAGPWWRPGPPRRLSSLVAAHAAHVATGSGALGLGDLGDHHLHEGEAQRKHEGEAYSLETCLFKGRRGFAAAPCGPRLAPSPTARAPQRLSSAPQHRVEGALRAGAHVAGEEGLGDGGGVLERAAHHLRAGGGQAAA